MPKHSAIDEYKWAVLAMLGDADLPYIGKPDNLLLRGRTLDKQTIALHINIPWLLEGHRDDNDWGWEVVSFSCQGRKLTRYGYINPHPTTDILDLADPDSNQRLLDMVKRGIETARERQMARNAKR